MLLGLLVQNLCETLRRMNAAAAQLRDLWTSVPAQLVKHRVPISCALFIALIAEDLIFWTKPNHGWAYQETWQGYVGLGLVVCGLAIRSWAAGVLRKGKDLTTEGPYSLCRHPLYVGSFLMMFGFCTLIDYWHDYLVIFGPITGIYWLTVLKEERRMAAVYPERWSQYAARTPRFLPWRLWNFNPGQWSTAQWLKSREYQAMLGATAGTIALELWRFAG